ncbi:histidine--tRNA ligase [Candidatus Peregrinibacteria bacterium CG10_big_fil_rev_8_21_14_0_10_36_19]|nr:MAG: histidine--tRNA ligase [Candidatus Peregrinibacteria bacterium CG10_big_fil_rev_8_21_14_0_10_36_19]
MSNKDPLRSPRAANDILPKDHEYHTYMKKVVRHRARQSGFKRISTPIFEYEELFKRSLGEDSDLFTKGLYKFEDQDGKKMALKPEGTSGLVRSYIQNEMDQLPQPVMLYYFEPHFRTEDPKKGTYRQFWQFGFEILGESDPALDAQLIQMCQKIYTDLGVEHLFTLQINTIGTIECREKYMQVLEDFYIGKERAVPPEYRELIHKNPMRLLEIKHEDLDILAQMAPSMRDYLDKESIAYHEELLEYLDELGIEYVENTQLSRGLDYYNKTVFEFWDNSSEGAENAVCGGGRYDGLVQKLGGASTPAVGFACGVERIIANMKREKIKVPSKDELHVFVAQLGKEAKLKCLGLIDELRERGIKTMGALGKGSINIQLGLANKFGVDHTVLIGLTEVREGKAIIRNMAKGTQETVKMEDVADKLTKLVGEKNLDKYSPGELLY